ncbi:MAG: helix-turn-helix domain-containing protein [Kosmotogaceae bacterium]
MLKKDAGEPHGINQREVVSRSFSELQRDGIISMPDRNTVEIRNLKRLEGILFD